MWVMVFLKRLALMLEISLKPEFSRLMRRRSPGRRLLALPGFLPNTMRLMRWLAVRAELSHMSEIMASMASPRMSQWTL